MCWSACLFAAADKDRTLRTALFIWGLLAISSILIMAIGLLWLIVRYRRTLKKRRPPVVYHDLRIGNEFEEFENPFNEPDIPEGDGPAAAKE